MNKSLEYLVTNVFLPLLIGGIGAYLYPKIGVYIKNRSVSFRQRKLLNLKAHYRIITKAKTNREYLDSERFVGVHLSIMRLGYLVAYCTIVVVVQLRTSDLSPMETNLLFGFGWALLSYSIISLYLLTTSYVRDERELFDFGEFRKKTIAKLEKQGGKPAELDEIDKEFEKKAIVKQRRIS